jgi:hypothetical protein
MQKICFTLGKIVPDLCLDQLFGSLAALEISVISLDIKQIIV